MAYIGSSPINKGTGLFSQDTFTGDGSTTTFDLTNIIPDGGGNDIQVFVDNVRQQEGSSNAYTIGNDGSGDLKRITFTTAPASAAAIYVLNPGTRNVQQISTVSDNAVTTAKINANAVTTAKILDDNITTAKILDANVTRAKLAADAIDATKLADDAVSEEHLDVTALTGHAELTETAADNDVLIIFDTSAGVLKKIQSSNVGVTGPTLSSVSPTNVVSGDGTGNHTFTLTGTNFTGASATLINTSGTTVNFDTVTVDSATQITGVIAKSSLPNSGEPYDVRVTGANGLQSTLLNQINLDASPTFNTAAGSLGTVSDGGRSSSTFDVEAFDPESTANCTFEIQSGSLPAGVTTSTVNENGVSKFRISGTFSAVGSNTTSNFVIRAVDAASNTSSRAFSITVLAPTSESFTSSGTFNVPSGVSSIDLLVVAGGASGASANTGTGAGGGGAGGLVFFPGYPVTPGGTVAVTVGCGGGTNGPSGGTGNPGSDSIFGVTPSPGLGQGGIITAKGGGGGGGGQGTDGGSSGGSGGNVPAGGSATQPTQPGNSGAYGFGNAGGGGGQSICHSGGGGGGGGAGAAGTAGGQGTNPQGNGGAGGAGKAYTIADGTTSVYYAGGGGGSASNKPGAAQGQGGQGGGTAGQDSGQTQDATANRGGGSGATRASHQAGAGGKGVVIVRY